MFVDTKQLKIKSRKNINNLNAIRYVGTPIFPITDAAVNLILSNTRTHINIYRRRDIITSFSVYVFSFRSARIEEARPRKTQTDVLIIVVKRKEQLNYKLHRGIIEVSFYERPNGASKINCKSARSTISFTL